ncbi:MAG TPA: ABC transporter ATP-binding protein [Microcoleaceae cyanobacterium]|jgi:ABC-type multidrug transport system fused ATPase/permease subunit
MKHQNWYYLRQRWQTLRQSLSLYRYCGHAIHLVWTTNRFLTIALASLTLIAGVLPAAIAYVGKLIVDAVVFAAQSRESGSPAIALTYLGIEAILVALLAGCRQGFTLCQSLLRMLLGQKVNLLILEKALTLEMQHFEDPEFYDKMTRARREASSRPLSLVARTFGLVQDTVSLVAYAGLLLKFSLLAVVILMLTAIPAFVAETRFTGEAFRLFQWRTPESREQNYLEWLMSNDTAAMEVKLYQLGPMLLRRYQAIFDRLYREDRNLTIRRGGWSYGLGLLSTAAFYSVYVWIILEAIARQISLGDLTMYLTVFRQGQSSFSNILTGIGGMYEDSLYLSNLYEFLDQEIPLPRGNAVRGIRPGDGLRFERVSFRYPGNDRPALQHVSFHLKPGEKLAIVGENGSGKTTLIKLLTRLYSPDAGRILLDGVDLQDWDLQALHRRIGVIFQNFARYQFTIGENIGAGDVDAILDDQRWAIAAEKGTAHDFIATLPETYYTRLGRWFKGGRELSGGQWQKIALARAFMRTQADILVLDEPTSAMDAAAEAQIFHHFRRMTQNQMAILISHRFSTVRMADQIIVLVQGEIVEQGSHEQLLQTDGLYAELFALQAAGYH